MSFKEYSKINMVCDSYVALEDAMLQNYIANKYYFSITNVAIMASMYDEFLTELKLKFSGASLENIDINSTNKFTYIEDEDVFFMDLVYEHKNKSWNINIYSSNMKVSNEIFAIVKKYEPSGMGVYIEIDNFFIDANGGISIRKEYRERADIIDVSSEYYPYLDTDILFKKYTLSNENILMLIGQPGVGKTKLVACYEKFMFSHNELFTAGTDDATNETMFRIAYIKNEEILAKDTFWEELNKDSYNLIFLDDADNCLLPRDADVHTNEDVNRKKFISQLLSFTDGIKTNDTKFIITTNRDVDNIDTAVLRRGRTFDILELQPLTYEEAQVIWENSGIESEKFVKLFKGKDSIVQSELGAEISLYKKLIGHDEANESYLLREDISLLHSYRNRKTSMGL
jgi:energy-coupling factor transporter ATP-binding protein EcfA2